MMSMHIWLMSLWLESYVTWKAVSFYMVTKKDKGSKLPESVLFLSSWERQNGHSWLGSMRRLSPDDRWKEIVALMWLSIARFVLRVQSPDWTELYYKLFLTVLQWNESLHCCSLTCHEKVYRRGIYWTRLFNDDNIYLSTGFIYQIINYLSFVAMLIQCLPFVQNIIVI